MTSAPDAKALVRRLVEIVNGSDLDALEQVAAGAVAEQARAWIGPFRESFPDFRMELVDAIAEGDRVVGIFKCSGTHRGEWLGHPASGRRFRDIDEVYVFRVEGERLAEPLLAVEDNLRRLRQLGLVGAPRA
jgi:predicted ester cyclase